MAPLNVWRKKRPYSSATLPCHYWDNRVGMTQPNFFGGFPTWNFGITIVHHFLAPVWLLNKHFEIKPLEFFAHSPPSCTVSFFLILSLSHFVLSPSLFPCFFFSLLLFIQLSLPWSLTSVLFTLALTITYPFSQPSLPLFPSVVLSLAFSLSPSPILKSPISHLPSLTFHIWAFFRRWRITDTLFYLTGKPFHSFLFHFYFQFFSLPVSLLLDTTWRFLNWTINPFSFLYS